MKFSLAIPHTPWVEERKESLKRLLQSLGPELADTHYQLFQEKEHYSVWSAKMWEWSASQDVTHCLFLQDDTVVAPEFWDKLRLLVAEHPDDVIGLQVAHPSALPLAIDGYQWFTTCDAVIGVGYLLPKYKLEDFLAWRATLPTESLQALTEDTLVGLWCALHRVKVFHPLPTIVDHDTTMASSYAELGNDSHPNRRSRARWDTPLPKRDRKSRIPHLGRFYQATAELLKKHVPNVSDATIASIDCDNGFVEQRRLHFARMADDSSAVAKVFVATPVRGGVTSQYAASVWRLIYSPIVDPSCAYNIVDAQQWDEDLVRVRSRFVHHFLFATDADYLFFVDGDIQFDPKVLVGMLNAKVDFVAAPYPKREGVDFDRVRGLRGLPPEAAAYRYSVHLLDGQFTLQANACAEIEAIGLGCALLSRNMLEHMWAQFKSAPACKECGRSDAPVFDDGVHGEGVALFNLDASLASEDFSFCRRWRAMGGKVHMYLGDGAPVNHVGSMVYKGAREAFGVTLK